MGMMPPRANGPSGACRNCAGKWWSKTKRPKLCFRFNLGVQVQGSGGGKPKVGGLSAEKRGGAKDGARGTRPSEQRLGLVELAPPRGVDGGGPRDGAPQVFAARRARPARQPGCLAAGSGAPGARGKLAQNEAAALDLPALAAFWNSDLGKRIRAVEASRVCRELAFTVRLSAEDLARLKLADAAAVKDEFIVAQGRIDVAVILPKEIWLLDFKTDQLTEADLEEKRETYAPQLELYALALSRIYHPRPVTERWLHFLSLGRTVGVEGGEGAGR